jgi:hypothetical protein
MSKYTFYTQMQKSEFTTHAPDTELLAKNVERLSAFQPFSTSCVFVQLYDGSWTEEPIAVRRMAASMPLVRPRKPWARNMLVNACHELL